MTRSRNRWLIVIAVLIVFSLWVDLSNNITIMNPFSDKPLINRNTELQLGLDIRGGLQTLLQADVANCASVDASALNVTRQILQNRVNALGISEITMQTAGNCRIIAEFPGVTDTQQVNDSLQQTALLEFVDMGSSPLPVGSTVETDFQSSSTSTQPSATATVPTATVAPTETATPAVTDTPQANATPEATPTAAAPAKIYHTVMTGADLDTVSVQVSSVPGQYEIAFTLKSSGSKVFGDFTSAHVGQYLAIVLDKKVISAPVINSAITGGQGVIQGNFTQASASALAVQLRYGSLPVPVKIVESQTVGPTLGAASVRKSVLAGAIGLAVVILFMALYYRLPGIVADLALVTYALLSMMIFKMVGFTLSLPGIAGFILSIGMAVDANVLIFERMKEELRTGRTLQQAIDLGWSRAWPSIRDSNTSTLITCVILYIFGNAYGASMVKGFAINLGLGVLVSLFTAVVVTRIYLHLVLDNVKTSEHPSWLGL